MSSAFCGRQDVLAPGEIEIFVETLENSKLEEIGTLGWMEKHERVERLTIQSIVEALSNREERVKDLLISLEKLTVLIHDIILIELWREIILPDLLKCELKCSFSVYTILFHEASCVNLLETVLYHQNAAEVLGDSVLDLTDYLLRAINKLVVRESGDKNGYSDPVEVAISIGDTKKGEMNVEQQSEIICLKISFKCLSCLRYIIENLERVESGVSSRLIRSSDTPMLLTQLLLVKPWIMKKKNKNGTFDELHFDAGEQQWKHLEPENKLKIGGIEVQVWLAIYQLFMNPMIVSSYEITDFRKSQLLKLRSLLLESTLDQIPVLSEFLRWINQLAVGQYPSTPSSKSSLIIEMLPPFRTRLEEEINKKKIELLEFYRGEIIDPSHNKLTEKAKRLSSLYDLDSFEQALPPSKCAACGKIATQKCSRCKTEFYCHRKCQVSHWSKHKPICDLINGT